MVKALFADAAFRDQLRLGAVNSINWARVVAQVVYYVTSAMALGATGATGLVRGADRELRQHPLGMGRRATWACPSTQLIIGSNRNDILTRFVDTGTMQITEVVPTMSPSMDIQVSSNFERVLFDLNGRDGGLTAEQMAVFRQSGRLGLEADQLQDLRASFVAASIDEPATTAQIAETYSLGHRARPAHGGRGGRGDARRPRSRHPARRARDGASGEVPRRRREGDRRAARAARPPRRSRSTDPSATRSWRTTSTRCGRFITRGAQE